MLPCRAPRLRRFARAGARTTEQPSSSLLATPSLPMPLSVPLLSVPLLLAMSVLATSVLAMS
ncbi:hypothetical protein, partial [Paractinoplanes brasiliensis]|uniref:hypothetical protein n=1 Tax=Paractinoplanes brasiliensis TaxID=52695 RepID=UPI0019408916